MTFTTSAARSPALKIQSKDPMRIYGDVSVGIIIACLKQLLMYLLYRLPRLYLLSLF